MNETTKLLDFNAFLPKLVNLNKLEKALMSVLSESGRTIPRESCASAQFSGQASFLVFLYWQKTTVRRCNKKVKQDLIFFVQLMQSPLFSCLHLVSLLTRLHMKLVTLVSSHDNNIPTLACSLLFFILL